MISIHTTRRLTVGISLLALMSAVLAQAAEKAQEPQRFDYAVLKGMARALSEKPYQSREPVDIPEIKALDYDLYQHIDFKDEYALWSDADAAFRVQFFHLGLYFQRPVRMYEVDDGVAQEIGFDPQMFHYGESGVKARKLPKDLGFAGFRINFEKDWKRDVAAFLGASYFRAVGFDWQYGLSARGLAMDTGMPSGEEFPDFIAFWLERPIPESETMVVYALLDSPSASGAYRFAITPGETLLMDVDAAVYPREVVRNVGIAPLTSMFQFGENDQREGVSDDWRPEVHDSDGLSIWSGTGEWLWRPLVNPPVNRMNSFVEKNPKGFGLLQRDRNFDHYQDDAVFYNARPNLWVEPKGNWGEGAIKLFEIPTVDETFDNVVAFWQPSGELRPGEERLFAYRLYWGSEAPVKPSLGRVAATRSGEGGTIGQEQNYFSRRFVIDFEGDVFGKLPEGAEIEAVATVSRGKAENVHARLAPIAGGCRAMVDVIPDDSEEPINIRLYLKSGDKTLSETWLYQYTPPPLAERVF